MRLNTRTDETVRDEAIVEERDDADSLEPHFDVHSAGCGAVRRQMSPHDLVAATVWDVLPEEDVLGREPKGARAEDDDDDFEFDDDYDEEEDDEDDDDEYFPDDDDEDVDDDEGDDDV